LPTTSTSMLSSLAARTRAVAGSSSTMTLPCPRSPAMERTCRTRSLVTA
jgi:hypothetical protein